MRLSIQALRTYFPASKYHGINACTGPRFKVLLSTLRFVFAVAISSPGKAEGEEAHTQRKNISRL